MDIEKFRTFITAAGLESFSEAAEELYLTTSAVSKHISALEAELGVTLFTRSGKKVALTEEGEVCLQSAKAIVREYDDLFQSLSKYNSINILTVPFQGEALRALQRFAQRHPEIHVRLSERHGRAAVSAVEKGEYELAFVGVAYSDSPFTERIPLELSPHGVILPKDHPLASRESVSIRELSGERFYMLARETGVYQFWMDKCREYGFTPNVAGTSTREDNIIAYVSEGGAAFFTRDDIAPYKCDQIRFVQLEENIMGGVVLLRHKSRPLSKPAAIFWNTMGKEYS